MMLLFRVLVFLTALLSPALRAAAEEADPAAALGQVQEELSSLTEVQAELAHRMAGEIRAQEELSGQLVDLGRRATNQETAMARIGDRIATLQAENAEALLALAKRRDSLSTLLAGLQRLEQNPPPALVVEPDDVLKALRGAMMFGAVIPKVRAETDALRAGLAHVERLKAELAAERQKAEETLAALEDTRGRIKTALEEKRQLSRANAEALAREQARAKALGEKAKSLKEFVASLEKAKAEQAAKLAKEEQARLAAEAAAEQAALEALNRPPMVFSMAQGKLDYPLAGKIVRSYGDDNGFGARMEGLLLAGAPSAMVLSPADGKIEFAGTFRDDQVVIINPGEGYLVLLAGMAEVSAYPGQAVRAGEPVGQMGQRPAALALAGDVSQWREPLLYVEFRKKNRSLDPAPWWVAGRKEAQR